MLRLHDIHDLSKVEIATQVQTGDYEFLSGPISRSDETRAAGWDLGGNMELGSTRAREPECCEALAGCKMIAPWEVTGTGSEKPEVRLSTSEFGTSASKE